MPLFTVNVTEAPGGPLHKIRVQAETPEHARKLAVKQREDAGDPAPLMTSWWREDR